MEGTDRDILHSCHPRFSPKRESIERGLSYSHISGGSNHDAQVGGIPVEPILAVQGNNARFGNVADLFEARKTDSIPPGIGGVDRLG